MLPCCFHKLVLRGLVLVALLYRLALRLLDRKLLDRKPDPLHLGHTSEPSLKSASDRFHSFLWYERSDPPRRLANTTKLKHLVPVDNQAPRF